MDLVTGGAGFVGSFLVDRLLGLGRSVRIFDIESPESIPGGAGFHRGDMRDYESVREAVRGVDTVFHLAFLQVFCRKSDEEKWEINYGGTKNFLDAAVEEGVSRFVQTSTIEVYSPFPPFPATEEAPTDRPMGWYGRHKKAVEELCMRYHREKGLPVTILRLPQVCGRGYYARIDMLRAFDWVIKKRPVLWIGGRQHHGDFVWVEDAVDGFVLCAEKEEAVGEVFNISCSRPSTSLEMIRAVMDAAGNKRKIHLVPPWLAWPPIRLATRLNIIDMPAEQLDYLRADYSLSIEKARRLLGYEPKMTAAQAAAELIRGYMEDPERAKEKAECY